MGEYLAQAGTFSKANVMWGLPEKWRVEEGFKSKVRLNDGNWYTDWVCGLGSNLLGYDEEFLKNVCWNIHDDGGVGFSLVHEIEYTVAEKLAKLLQANVPGWESTPIKVRFCKTGSEATTMAVRLARAVRYCKNVAVFSSCYHGWNDWTICRTDPAYGAVGREDVYVKEWENTSTLDENIPPHGLGAVIFEHPSMDVTNSEWYDELREFAHRHNGLLIADEVVTGLRYGLGGACQRFNIKPDLVCMGKALGNGFPIAAVVGPAEYLDWFGRVDPVFCSSTGWGETASLYAADYVLDNWNQFCVDQLWGTGSKLLIGMERTGWDIFGHPPRSVMRFKNEKERAFFIRYMFEHNILMNRPNLPNLCHTDEDVEKTVQTAAKGFEIYSNMSQTELDKSVDGRMPRVLFSNR